MLSDHEKIRLSDYQEIGFQELAPEVQQEFRGLQEKLRLDGPLVGGLVYPGKDSVALAVHQGEVWCLLQVPLAASSVDIALRYFNGLSRVATHPVATRISGTTLLYARPLMRGMAEAFQSLSLERSATPEEKKRIHMLVSEIRTVHEAELFHGALSSEEILWGKSKIILLDCGLQFFRSPESRKATSLLMAVESGQSRDRQFLVKFLEPHVPRADRLSLLSLPEERHAFFEALLRLIEPSVERSDERQLFQEVKSTSPVSRVKVKAQSLRPEKRPSDAPTSPEKKERSGTSSSNKKQHPWILVGVLSFGLFVVFFFVLNSDLKIPLPWSPFGTESDVSVLQEQWSSGNRAQMIHVAQAAAIHGDRSAQNVILDSIQSSERNEKLLLWDVLRVVVELRWLEGLSDRDRAALFAFALAPLLRENLQEIPDFSKVDGKVVLALLGGMPADKEFGGLFKILSSQREHLPPEVSSLLEGEDIQKSGNPALFLRAFMRIRAGIDLPTSLQYFLPPTLLLPEVQSRLNFLSANGATRNAAALLQHVQRLPALSDTLLWFTHNPLVDWSTLTPDGVLALLSGSCQIQEQFDLNLLADLLRAPFLSQECLAAAVGELEKRLMRPNVAPFLVAIAQEKHLTREQAVSLVAALNVRGDSTHVFIDRWFEMQPAPESVAYLLLAAAESYEPKLKQYAVEAFHLSAARYLRAREGWSLSPEQLKGLADHPEALARGIAYSRASVNKPEERVILEERVKKESVSSLKKLLTDKLSK